MITLDNNKKENNIQLIYIDKDNKSIQYDCI